MSKHEKTLEKLFCTPTPSDVRWTELTGLLKYLGYESVKQGKTGGSRRKFYHKGINDLIICHQPHPSPVLGRKCVRNIAEQLKNKGFF